MGQSLTITEGECKRKAKGCLRPAWLVGVMITRKRKGPVTAPNTTGTSDPAHLSAIPEVEELPKAPEAALSPQTVATVWVCADARGGPRLGSLLSHRTQDK